MAWLVELEIGAATARVVPGGREHPLGECAQGHKQKKYSAPAHASAQPFERDILDEGVSIRFN
ncbi:hypothetical protein SAMN05192554_11239 [Haloarchaeobius iranensis]|uniref:Uncharacterized protein n=1 Tax=Haloarchaeobius iranensis TaxID=996166 RepID=A0A1G9XY51_9EURY|nr:hypothetical protein SAMN05192554_11239 [Haloarchaeobius iranensis]